jgi:hypothetical protein
MTHQNHILAMSVSITYFVAQLATGTSVSVASLFSLAILFGLYSVWAAGGLSTAPGALNAILIGKFLLIGIVLKTMMWDPADKNLLAADSTAAVMAIGFLGLWIGTSIQAYLPAPRNPFVPCIADPRMFLALTLVFVVLGYGGYAVGLSPDLAGEGMQTGGALGIARVFGSLKSFAIVPALFFAWARRSPRFMSHPLPMVVLCIGIVGGVFSTGKLEAMEPLVFWLLVGTLRYGVRDRRILTLGALAAFYYAAIVYPYAQYVRFHGGRQGSLSARVQSMKEVFWQVATDSEFRHSVIEKEDDQNSSYLGSESLKPFGRLAMVGQADRLVAATIQLQSWTGWFTVKRGIELASPSFINAEKPVFGAGNYMGHITGEVTPQDNTTQVSYGVMATFFNAFSYIGVSVGTVVFFSCFYYLIRLFFGSCNATVSPSESTMWFVFIVATFQHSLVEETVSGLMTCGNVYLAIVAICMMARVVCLLLPKYAGAELYQ